MDDISPRQIPSEDDPERAPGREGEPDEILPHIIAGSEEAFDAFVEQSWDLAVGYAHAFLSRLDEARDVAQSAFVELWERHAGLDPEGSARALLLRIVRSRALDQLRRRRVRRVAAEELGRIPTRRPTDPQAEIEARELERAVEAAIRCLPERRREAFVLARFHGLSHREIAEVMDVSPQTVANQISSALADLREALEPYFEGEG